MRASSASQSQPSPSRYSQPRPAGGARDLMVSNPASFSSTAVASTTGYTRTRFCVVTVSERSA